MIRKVIEDKELSGHIASLPPDGREVFLIGGDNVRLSAVSATTMVNSMRANHGTGLLETYMLGQGYIAGALLSSTVKGNDRILMQIQCGGPVKGMSIEAWASGAVRGYLVNNPIPLSAPLESLDTSLIYGPGFLTITKYLEGSKTPFSGDVMLGYGNLANDLALYFKESEQTPSLFYLSIDFDKEGRVWGAGGLFMQALPGCPDSTLEKLQEESSRLGRLGRMIGEGMSVREYVETELSAFHPHHIGHTPIGFSCPCTRESFTSYLSSLPAAEKDEILKGEFPLELECLNCGSRYSYTKEEFERIHKGA